MERYKLDVVNKTLVITEGFNKKIQDIESAEFAFYTELMERIPGLTVVRKTHKSPAKCTSKSSGEVFKCNQFKNLTYQNMERFMSALPQAKSYQEQYNFIRDYAARIQANGYTLVRRWFIAQFPQFRKNPLFYVYNTPTLVKASDIIQEEKQEAPTQDEAA